MAIIQRLDGETYDLKEDFGIRTVDIVISSPSPRHVTGEIEGRDGLVDYGTDYEPRTITASFRMFAKDMPDFPLLRDEVFHVFRSKEPFYFIEKRRRGKRWKVKMNSSFDIEQAFIKGSFDIEMIAYLPYAESIGTTQDIQRNGISADDELWGFGMGLIDEMSEFEYISATWFYVGDKKWSDI